MQIDWNIKKNWLARSWEKEGEGSATISTEEASSLAHFILSVLIPSELWHSQSVRNMKGRDANNLLISHFTGQEKPEAQEFLFVQGYCGSTNHTLTYRLHSEFESFKGSDINHVVREKRSRTMPLFLLPQYLGYVAPLTITHLRFGIERYQSILKALSFGSVPEVTEQLLVDICHNELRLLIRGEQLKSESALPFGGGGIAEQLLTRLETLQIP
ncbi:MAG: hypothetical protein KDD70_08210 [Bdellovibrionales bacterium]|nr:hypothetical protein [Bdellovibrionales bacterium]